MIHAQSPREMLHEAVSSFILENALADDRWMCVSHDPEEITTDLLPAFVNAARKVHLYLRHALSPYPRVWWETVGGGPAEIVFRSGKYPGKLRGPAKSGLWFDDITQLSPKAFETAFATLRHRGKVGPCVLTFPLEDRQHVYFLPDGQVDERLMQLVGSSVSEA